MFKIDPTKPLVVQEHQKNYAIAYGDNLVRRPEKLILAFPDTIEVSDSSGKLHTYSLTELLDGLYRLAKKSNKRAKKEQK